MANFNNLWPARTLCWGIENLQEKLVTVVVWKMGSKSVAPVALMLSLNLLLFSMVSCNAQIAHHNKPIKCPAVQVCANILQPPYQPDRNCCPLISGLVDLDAAVCLCAVLKLNVGGIITVNLDLLVNLLLNACGRKQTTYTCK